MGALETNVQGAIDSGADLLVMAMRNDAFKYALKLLQSKRSTHTFKSIWTVQVPWGDSCAGTYTNCSYMLGATQISSPQAKAQTDDVLGITWKQFLKHYPAGGTLTDKTQGV